MHDIIALVALAYIAIEATPYTTYVLYDAEIFDRPRMILKRIGFVDAMLECLCCTSFWGGLSSAAWCAVVYLVYLFDANAAVILALPIIAMAGAKGIVLEKMKNALHSTDFDEPE